MKLKTGILMLLVGIAVIGIAANSVSADIYMSVHCHGSSSEVTKEKTTSGYLTCIEFGNGHSWSTAWGDGASDYDNDSGNDCSALAQASSGYAYAYASCA